MNRLDLTPLYRNSIGYDRFASLIESALQKEQSPGYPPYNIALIDETHYEITLAVAGFDQQDIDIVTENNRLSIKGKKQQKGSHSEHYLHQGIALRSFERQFNLADHVKVVEANLENGLLKITLEKQIPESMKPVNIAINVKDKKVAA